MTAICEGLNVIELGAGSSAASLTGMVLADAGARVIKVEPPEGDLLRTHNPSGFKVWNRGKESIVIDLRTSKGQQHLRDLAIDADVVVEGFSPGTTTKWGIGAGDLRAANPALIHCSITGFGPAGAYSGLKSYDTLVSAKAGLGARGAFGHREGPIMFPVPWGSFGSAMQATAGILGALIVRDQTGRGQSLDATLVNGIDPLDYFAATIVQLVAKKGESPSSDARSDSMVSSRYGVLLVTKDSRFVQTSTLLPHQGQALCDVAGIGHVTEEPRFSRLPMFDTPEDAQEWEDQLLAAFREHDLDHWLPKLLASPDVAFEVAGTSEDGLDHPQIVHNGDVITVDDPEVGPIRQVGPIGHFTETPIEVTSSAPALGDNRGSLEPGERPLTTDGDAPAHPFAGKTVVEFGYFYAMPYATAMLAALGARVIKIEDSKGDPHRYSFGPEVATNKTTAGKESLSVDLRSAEGRKIAHELIARADAFVTGFRSGIAEKLGLGYEDLEAVNPHLLYVHAAGYGADGPYAGRALYAQAAQAVGGAFGRQVGPWIDPAKSIDMSVLELQAIVLPRLNAIVDGDSNAALALLAALSLGLYHQHRSGEGQFMRTSMIAGNAWAYSDDFCTYEGKPPIPLCDDDYYGTSALHRLYQAANDSWVCLEVRSDNEFAALVETLGVPDLLDDDRFASAEARAKHDAELIKALGDRFQEKPATEWEAALSTADVGGVEVNMQGHAVFTSYDPVLRETGLTVTVQHPLYGELVRAAPPVSFSDGSGRVAPPCVRGEHNRDILEEIGRNADQIDELEASGVVTPPSPPPTD